ncbi:hypothetical protein [Dyadobacter diqingensis]|nr:hypothetical protein [Dyadobacter diqingensis]
MPVSTLWEWAFLVFRGLKSTVTKSAMPTAIYERNSAIGTTDLVATDFNP